MNDKETRTFQMLTRFDAFCDTLTGDFAANSIGKQLFANLKTRIAEAESRGAAAASGRTSVRHGTGMRGQARTSDHDERFRLLFHHQHPARPVRHERRGVRFQEVREHQQQA